MLRTKKLVSALALALAGMGTAAQAQEFTAVISFGDSLSDAGQYSAFIPGAGSFTTNPDDVWTQVLASAWGYSQTPSVLGGTDYAWGGAPTSFTVPGVPLPLSCVPATLPCSSVAQQMATHLAANGGHAVDGALYTYWAGANDLFEYLRMASPQPGPAPPLITPTQAQLFTGASALNAVGQIRALQTAGADYIVVLNLPDIGMTPAFRNTANQATVSGLVFVYNDTFNQGLATLQDGIIPINAYALINEAIADPGAFGFTNVTSPACTTPSSLFCTTGTLVTPGANETYLFADGVHPTGAAHALLARVVYATITAPGQVSMAGEIPLQVYNNHSGVINSQVFGISGMDRAVGESNVYGQLQYGNRDFEPTVNTAAFDSNLATATLGADVRYTDHISLGAALSYGGTRGDSWAHSIDANEVLISAYGVAHFGKGYVAGIASGGTSSLEIERAIDFNGSTRVEHGDTSAQHWAFEIVGGFAFGGEDFHHGPFVSLTNERVKVKGYSEDALDSTAMWFSDFTRSANVGRIGYQARGSFGTVSPFGRVAYAKDRDSDGHVSLVQAGSNTMNGHFTFPGYIAAENWYEGELGLAWQMNDRTELSASWRARFNDDGEDYNALALGFRMEFGAEAPAPAAEVVEEVAAEPEPVQTCSDLDDDGDGINNCDDKCPTSASGETVGPDGCAPEPEMAPKPFRE